jgi:flavodoxin I
MKKVCIVYASLSGNTEKMALLIGETLQEIAVDYKWMELTEPAELLNYDGIVVGAYTWGDGELPYEAEEFCAGVSGLNLRGIPTAVFGSGDRAYPRYAVAVDMLHECFTAAGATMLAFRLKVELAPDSAATSEECRSFAESFQQLLQQTGRCGVTNEGGALL